MEKALLVCSFILKWMGLFRDLLADSAPRCSHSECRSIEKQHVGLDSNLKTVTSCDKADWEIFLMKRHHLSCI